MQYGSTAWARACLADDFLKALARRLGCTNDDVERRVARLIEAEARIGLGPVNSNKDRGILKSVKDVRAMFADFDKKFAEISIPVVSELSPTP